MYNGLIPNLISIDDRRGVKGFVGYSTATGKFTIEHYRKKTKEESQGDHDWKMIRIGHVHSYNTREEAENITLKLCEKICKEFGF